MCCTIFACNPCYVIISLIGYFFMSWMRFQRSPALFMYIVYFNIQKETQGHRLLISPHPSLSLPSWCACVFVCFDVFRTEPLMFGQNKDTTITGMIMGHWKFKQIFERLSLFLGFFFDTRMATEIATMLTRPNQTMLCSQFWQHKVGKSCHGYKKQVERNLLCIKVSSFSLQVKIMLFWL